MKKTKTILAILFAIAITFTMAACGPESPSSSDSSVEASVESSVEEVSKEEVSVDDSSVDVSEDSTSDTSIEESLVPDDSSIDESSVGEPSEESIENPTESEQEPDVSEESVDIGEESEESNPSEDVSEESIPSESSEEVSEEPEVSEEEPEECVHSYKETVVEATCKAGGYTLHKCEKCGEEYKTDKTEKGEHQFGEMWTGLFNNALVVQCKACGAEPLSNAKCEHRFVAMEWYNEEYDCPVYYLCEGCGKIENRYDCGNPVHKQYGTCDNPSEHANYVSKEEEGCRHCGEHDCLCIYTNKSEDCPKYDPMKDDRVICQTCGKERGIGLGKCTTLLMDGNCIHCGAFIKAGECHECPYELKTEYYYFDANGGDLNGFPEKLECLENEALDVSVATKINGEPAKYPMPTREGYLFACWSFDPNKEFKWEVNPSIYAYLSKPGTYYAIWVKE